MKVEFQSHGELKDVLAESTVTQTMDPPRGGMRATIPLMADPDSFFVLLDIVHDGLFHFEALRGDIMVALAGRVNSINYQYDRLKKQSDWLDKVHNQTEDLKKEVKDEPPF